jgi:hypothetical protein
LAEPSPNRRRGRTGRLIRRRAGPPLLAALALAGGLPGAWAHGKAHQHAVATMEVAVEGSRLLVRLDSPLANIIGFERAPRTDYERQRVNAAVARLRAGEALFKTYAPAGCVLSSAQLDAPVIGLKAEGGAATARPVPAGKNNDPHAELAGSYEFECRQPEELKFIDVGLFSAFSGFRRIDVQVAGPGGQSKQTLQPKAARITLAR